MKKLVIAIFSGVLILTAWGAGDLSDLRGLVLTHAKLPVYNKQNLQAMAFCDKAERSGRMMVGHDVVLDLIRRGADVDSIRNGWGLKAYPLDAKLPELLAFWSMRPYSDGVILTSLANVDQETRMADGDEPVFFRSPLLDLNGVGFEADFDRRTVLVKENVKIVVRMGASDPRRLLAAGGELPAKYEFATASSDSMRIDMAANQVLLVGSVVVDETNSVVTCDRMTIFFDRRSDAEIKAANDRGSLGSGADMGGVSRVLCDGNVVITRKLSKEEIAKNGEQQALADHLVYDPAEGTVILTGDKRLPEVRRGVESLSGETMTLHRLEQRAVIQGRGRVVAFQPPQKPGEKGGHVTVSSDEVQLDYLRNYGEFVGNVVADEPRMQLKCARMRINLKELAQEKAVLPTAASLSGMPEFDAGNRRELDRITCLGGVEVVRRDAAGKLLPGERGTSENAVFDYHAKNITMTGGNPTLKRNYDSLSGGELVIWIDEERICAHNGSKVVLVARAPKAGQRPGKVSETVILSDSSDLNYGGNLLTFSENVKVSDERMNLDCDRMDIHLARKNAADAAKASANDMLSLGDDPARSDRTLSQVVCTGHVHAVDSNSDLRCDKFTMHFAPLPPGVTTPGMFQSNGTELVLINADGNFEGVNTPMPDEKERAAQNNDLGGLMKSSSGKPRRISADRGQIDFREHLTEFHGDVFVRDEENSLKCDDLYLFAGEAAAVPEKGTAPSQPDLDDDPFALEVAETVPPRISLTEELDLKRVLCQNKVLFVRRTTGGELQRAGGQEADYIVANREMIVTGNSDERPWMSAGGHKLYSDRIVVDVVKETMRGENGTAKTEKSGKSVNF